MQFIPIKETLEENIDFFNNPLCRDTLEMTVDFFSRIGYVLPWIGYYVEQEGKLVGSAAYKGKPVNRRVEIAYGTFSAYQHQGIGTLICRKLVELSLKTDPSVIITARTLPEENFSARVLKKNNFINTGIIEDPEDGQVLEWLYAGK
jgi:[ribosomal protein S5]-alanine N-acetyltransferase